MEPLGNLFPLDQYRPKIEGRVHCKDCGQSYVTMWSARIGIDKIHCAHCANQSLEMAKEKK
jgi:hypothetical protein